MSEKKELKNKELEKVSGGMLSETTLVVVKYQDVEDGPIASFDLGEYEIEQAQAMAESMAKEWCLTNNKIYVGYRIGANPSIFTQGFDARKLLDSLGQN